MALIDQIKIIKELREGPGETLEERTDAVLSKRGWDKQLADITDDNFRALVRHALERLAMRGHAPDARTPGEIERDRQRKETEAIAALNKGCDFFSEFVGLSPDKLAGKLPREQYWVESLGRFIPRDQLASKLQAVAELRRVAHECFLKADAITEVYRWEMAIFDELLRQGSEPRPPKTMDTAHPQ